MKQKLVICHPYPATPKNSGRLLSRASLGPTLRCIVREIPITELKMKEERDEEVSNGSLSRNWGMPYKLAWQSRRKSVSASQKTQLEHQRSSVSTVNLQGPISLGVLMGAQTGHTA